MNIVGFAPGSQAAPGSAEAKAAPGAAAGEGAAGFASLLAGLLGLTAPAAAPAAEEGAEGEGEGEEGAAGAAEAGDARAAAPAPLPADGGDVSRIYRGLEGLSPEFRGRLERVIDRMEAEGHTVRVNETVRSQARQEHLYAQGRSRPGPVVTWTLDSNHRGGRAADLVIDGRYDNPAGYARLAQLAQEEGLRTLGPRDPGHVELPRRPGEQLAPAAFPQGFAAAAEPARGALPPREAMPAHGLGLARVAQVAEVARVAQVAEVARVADPREGAAGVGRAAPAAQGVPAELSAAVAARFAQRGGGEGGAADGRPGSREQPEGQRGEQRIDAAAALMSLSTRGESTAGAAGGVERVTGTDITARIARVIEMQQADASRPVSSLLLRMENGAGGEDRIRVGLRGTLVDTQLELGDPAVADRASARVDDLRRALERQGLEAESVQIRSTATRPEVAEGARLAGALLDDVQRTFNPSRSGGEPQSQQQQPQPRGRGQDPHSPHPEPEQSFEQQRRKQHQAEEEK